MGVQLLTNAPAGVYSVGYDVSPAKGAFGANVLCSGTTGDKVQVQVSGSASLDDWINHGSAVTVPGEVAISNPVERVRCFAVGTNTGRVWAYYESGV